jgi:hypothetical protein
MPFAVIAHVVGRIYDALFWPLFISAVLIAVIALLQVLCCGYRRNARRALREAAEYDD